MSDRLEHTQVPDITGSGGIIVSKPTATTIDIAGGSGGFGVLTGLNHFTKASDVDNIIVLPGVAVATVGTGTIDLPTQVDQDSSQVPTATVGGSLSTLFAGWRGLYLIGDSTLTNPPLIVNKGVDSNGFVDPTTLELSAIGHDQSTRIGSFFFSGGAFRASHSIREFTRNGDQITYTNSADSLVRWLSTNLAGAESIAAPGVTAKEGASGNNITGVLTADFTTFPVDFSTFAPPGSLAINTDIVAGSDDFIIFSTPGDSGFTTSGGQILIFYSDNSAPDHTLSLEKRIALSSVQIAKFRFSTILTGAVKILGIYANGYTDKV